MIIEEDKETTISYIVQYKKDERYHSDYIYGFKKFINYELASLFYEQQSAIGHQVSMLELTTKLIKKTTH